ncbi:hypothetical protein VKT23_018321 [Stygiomarasmius scandens]|uniref:Uncharacterized protein n=1 Tax=Marasmiellus scandens TaxID=2682957 RepID=A0ABR1ISC7_9AGAR
MLCNYCSWFFNACSSTTVIEWIPILLLSLGIFCIVTEQYTLGLVTPHSGCKKTQEPNIAKYGIPNPELPVIDSCLETSSEPLIGFGSYTRRKVLKARVKRRRRQNHWPWRTPHSKLEDSHEEDSEKLETCTPSTNDSGSQRHSQPPRDSSKNSLDQIYVYHLYTTFWQSLFWSSFVSHANHIGPRTKTHIPPHHLRLLETKLGVPRMAPPASGYTRFEFGCLFGRCDHPYWDRQFIKEHLAALRIRKAKRCAREYYALRQAGCLEDGHALGWKNGCFCEGKLGRSWARVMRRCEEIYRIDSGSAMGPKSNEQKLREIAQAWHENSALSRDMFIAEDSTILFHEGVTALQIAEHLDLTSPEKNKHMLRDPDREADWASMSRYFSFIFGCGSKDIWNKPDVMFNAWPEPAD